MPFTGVRADLELLGAGFALLGDGTDAWLYRRRPAPRRGPRHRRTLWSPRRARSTSFVRCVFADLARTGAHCEARTGQRFRTLDRKSRCRGCCGFPFPRQLLRAVNAEKDQKRKRDVIKKVIAYMTLGIDVSRLFSDMVLVRRACRRGCQRVFLPLPSPPVPLRAPWSLPRVQLVFASIVAAVLQQRLLSLCAVPTSVLSGIEHKGHRREEDGVPLLVQLRRLERRPDPAGHQHPAKRLVRASHVCFCRLLPVHVIVQVDKLCHRASRGEPPWRPAWPRRRGPKGIRCHLACRSPSPCARSRDEDPMIRGLALRSLCSLRLDTIVEYSTAPLKVRWQRRVASGLSRLCPSD